MIKVQEYRGHIRNWESLCRELGIDTGLSREEREEQILVKAYETWGCHMADHMHGMFAFALWDDEEKELFCLRDQFGTKPFFYYETADGESALRNIDPSDHGAAGICKRAERGDAAALSYTDICGGRKYLFPRREEITSGTLSDLEKRENEDRALLETGIPSG